MNVAIVGLGLIGGSMAKSIKNRTSHTVWGIDLNAETMTMARMCGAIDAPLTEAFVSTGSINCAGWAGRAHSGICLTTVRRAAQAALSGSLYGS